MIDVELLKGTVSIYLTLSSGKLAQDGFMPRVNLDKAIHEQTEEFYRGKSIEIMESTNLIDYLRVVDKFKKDE